MPVRHELIPTVGVPIKIWTNDVDVNSIGQLSNTAALPCVFHHVAAMPDVHFGMGATVGSVVATKNAVIPAAVGVDIGCGMMAAKLPFTASDLPDSLKALRSDMEWAIPVGFNWHKEPTIEAEQWWDHSEFLMIPKPLHDREMKSLRQLGTLGGGNHFVELCLDVEKCVWLMLHSGSRGIGNDIAKVHIERAQGLFGDSLRDLADRDLAYLAEGTPEFAAYWRDLQWAQAYAFKNREIMMTRALRSVAKVLLGDWRAPIVPTFQVNCHHNYAERETHYGEEVIVTRKGAVRAGLGDFGIIPGSMGARSFIVRGRGNAESFNSCSHGAGRRMSRTQAKKQFTTADLVAQTEGVECRKDTGVIDEIPGAYKDIQAVMDNQSDLVEIVAELKQVLCVKG
jgi:tRNA-splicing ligase RtcB